MDTSIAIWNVRGIGDREKRSRFKRLIRRYNPKIVGLVETKLSNCDDRIIGSLYSRREFEWVAKNAVRSSGGIAVFWDKLFYTKLSSSEGNHFIVVELFEICSSKVWHFVVVYGPQERIDKLAFLSELQNYCSQQSGPICIADEFNMVRNHDDYQGSRRSSELMFEFNSFIDNNGLLELPLGGSRFTWSHGVNRDSRSRIDRVLISQEFDVYYSDRTLTALERVESVHNLLVLKWGQDRRIKRPWRFQNMWLEDERFYENMNSWMGERLQGNGGMFLLAKRLLLIKAKLKVWNKEVFGSMDVKIGGIITEN
ncbi:unnamed protein product [Linum trigynum]|uniref:Endonuclease/exonuclease/phosphatase domain-containing protein n=1 Tax=Linum trigynum TaxID=586398 RepID=A0AAV2GTM6_9ROSI